MMPSADLLAMPGGLAAALCLIVVVAMTFACAAVPPRDSARGTRLVRVDSPSPLVDVRISILTGSADDPIGKEGLARLTANLLLEGGFGDPKSPVTKEKLAEITQPWGSDARPGVIVDKELTTFEMTVPEEVLPEFVAKVLRPMLGEPLFLDEEVHRLANETAEQIR